MQTNEVDPTWFSEPDRITALLARDIIFWYIGGYHSMLEVRYWISDLLVSFLASFYHSFLVIQHICKYGEILDKKRFQRSL